MLIIKQKSRQIGQNYLTKHLLQVTLNPASKFMKETVKELRQSGYKVKCLHFRNKTNILAGQWLEYPINAPKGGKTEVHIISPEGVKASGEAKCSNKENYCRKTGVKIALGRALKALEKERNPFEDN